MGCNNKFYWKQNNTHKKGRYNVIIYLQAIESPDDKHKFEILYHAYRGLMFRIAKEILKDEQDAEDAVHTAFVTIAENMQKIEEPLCPKTKGYIVIIVESKSIDLYRRKQKNAKVLPLEEELVGSATAYEDSYAISRCISLLPSQDKYILLLKYEYGYDNREIAKILNISQSSAIKRIQRAKQKLEKICAEEGLL